VRKEESMGREGKSHQKVRCPECLGVIWVRDGVELWDPITCPECHTALEVVKLNPLELDYLEALDDWDDDFEEAEW
jgi:lysine biosynthesis protein LysW